MKCISDLFEAMGGVTGFGQVIGKSAQHASVMKHRGSIPVRYWPQILMAAKKRGLGWITADELMKMHNVRWVEK